MDLKKELRTMVKYMLTPEDRDNDIVENYVDTLALINDEYIKQLSMSLVNQCLLSDEKMYNDLFTIIDTNLSCSTGQEAGILCNKFTTTSIIIDYIKNLIKL